MRRLSAEEFRASFTAPMKRLPPDESPPFEFWNYFEGIPEADFEGRDASEGTVTHVWEDSSKRYQHVLVNTTTENVFMVLVLDLVRSQVYGHRLLNLDREYGLDPCE